MRRTLALALTATSLLAAACHGEDAPAPGPDERVRQALQRFEDAAREERFEVICSDLLARELLAKLDAIALPCAIALEQGLGGRAQPDLEVLRVRVNGRSAAADVRSTAVGEKPSTDTIALTLEDDSWKIVDLAGAQPPEPEPEEPEAP